MPKLPIRIGAAETMDTLYPYFRAREDSYEAVVARPSRSVMCGRKNMPACCYLRAGTASLNAGVPRMISENATTAARPQLARV